MIYIFECYEGNFLEKKRKKNAKCRLPPKNAVPPGVGKLGKKKTILSHFITFYVSYHHWHNTKSVSKLSISMGVRFAPPAGGKMRNAQMAIFFSSFTHNMSFTFLFRQTSVIPDLVQGGILSGGHFPGGAPVRDSVCIQYNR